MEGEDIGFEGRPNLLSSFKYYSQKYLQLWEAALFPP